MKSSYVSARHVTIDDWTAASPQASLESSSECIAKLGVLVWTALVKHRSSQIHGCASRQQGSTLTTTAGPKFPRGPRDGWGPLAPPPQTRLLHGRQVRHAGRRRIHFTCHALLQATNKLPSLLDATHQQTMGTMATLAPDPSCPGSGRVPGSQG